MFRKFQGLSIVMRVMMATLLVFVFISGVVFAAWEITKTTGTTALVLGTFTLKGLECDDAVEGEEVACSATVTNLYDESVEMTHAVLIPDRTDVTVTPVECHGSVVDVYPVTVAPGETVTLMGTWTPDVGAVLGEVAFELEVTVATMP